MIHFFSSNKGLCPIPWTFFVKDHLIRKAESCSSNFLIHRRSKFVQTKHNSFERQGDKALNGYAIILNLVAKYLAVFSYNLFHFIYLKFLLVDMAAIEYSIDSMNTEPVIK